MTGRATIMRGDVLHLALADDSVDLIVTSPPYFGLRSYQDGGEHYDGQIGDEPTPGEFVDALIAATAEMVRVLKPSGSIWVNLGDKYLNKSLAGIPWRYALRCIDDLGLILRAEVIWAKPNGLPESVTDRVRRSHEQWFHFTVQSSYYSAVDAIREDHHAPGRVNGNQRATDAYRVGAGDVHRGLRDSSHNDLGKLPGSVWTIATQPLHVPDYLGVDHFAAFPMEWPRRIITGWSPAGVCTACGEGRRPVAVRTAGEPDSASEVARLASIQRERVSVGGGATTSLGRRGTRYEVTGEECGCPDPTAPTTPGVVLDPFGGTGTTALLAKALGRHGISHDMSADYCRLAAWRTNDEGELARAMQVKKPVEQVPGQISLLDFGEPA